MGTESSRRSSLSLLCLTDRIWLAGFMSADMGAYLLYAGLVTPLGTHGYSRACLLYAGFVTPLGTHGYSRVSLL